MKKKLLTIAKGVFVFCSIGSMAFVAWFLYAENKANSEAPDNWLLMNKDNPNLFFIKNNNTLIDFDDTTFTKENNKFTLKLNAKVSSGKNKMSKEDYLSLFSISQGNEKIDVSGVTMTNVNGMEVNELGKNERGNISLEVSIQTSDAITISNPEMKKIKKEIKLGLQEN
ncbi:hypothetical protein SAMN02745116_00683 [Pilibacter termitis]|uniref:Uncharacterized protein n=1 Tax=Pilibacter termitis TaxID=263852 RepID=A0A1T4LJM6_9ENTE|nr:hypothetical protein [Pilibacter termitis]SJZ54757.1 hypothetical protein SAMN02745116_00683 [Pilibacter termitis]